MLLLDRRRAGIGLDLQRADALGLLVDGPSGGLLRGRQLALDDRKLRLP